VEMALVEEELAWGDAGAAFALAGPGALAHFVLELGDAEQQKHVLSSFGGPAGAKRRGAVAWTEPKPSAREGLATRAHRDGDAWVLDGEKTFVLDGGIADDYVVFAQLDEGAGWSGLGAFHVTADAPGLVAGARIKTLGLDAAHVGGITLRGVRVRDSARLLGGTDFGAALVRAFARHALWIAARRVGLASRAFDLAYQYTQERTAFGKPIGHFQAIAFTVCDRLMDVESARWMTWRAASEWDAGRVDLRLVAAASAHASEVAMRAGDDGVQLHGGAGFIRDFAIEKLMRDAKQIGIVGWSAATADQLLASQELGAKIDLAAALPTPDVQAVCV
ncbi:MAG: acyl-CoA dehydrogenase family protein, partial [Deltaproteobacteria bacterium]|nr:acyl-CoA dehydrogenase family protein [Deltaproteobacteria bacterium]